MPRNSPARFLILLLAATCGLGAGGCWSAHPHSAYRLIHQYAISGDLTNVTAELAQHPDELNLPEDDGLTPLHLAAENCHTNVVVLLLDRGAKIDVLANDDATPLHLAAQEGCADVVTVLLAHKARTDMRDKQGRTPLDRARLWKQTNIVTLLQQHGVNQ